MTRASSIKDFHQFATLTVTIPLEVALVEISTSVDIREIENLMRCLDKLDIRVMVGLFLWLGPLEIRGE